MPIENEPKTFTEKCIKQLKFWWEGYSIESDDAEVFPWSVGLIIDDDNYLIHHDSHKELKDKIKCIREQNISLVRVHLFNGPVRSFSSVICCVPLVLECALRYRIAKVDTWNRNLRREKSAPRYAEKTSFQKGAFKTKLAISYGVKVIAKAVDFTVVTPLNGLRNFLYLPWATVGYAAKDCWNHGPWEGFKTLVKGTIGLGLAFLNLSRPVWLVTPFAKVVPAVSAVSNGVSSIPKAGHFLAQTTTYFPAKYSGAKSATVAVVQTTAIEVAPKYGSYINNGISKGLKSCQGCITNGGGPQEKSISRGSYLGMFPKSKIGRGSQTQNKSNQSSHQNESVVHSH
jgi:hypothetical protein